MISRFFKTFFYLLSGAGTWVDGAEWSNDDALALGAFLRTETGAKLSARLRNASLSLNANAVQEGDHKTCGRAYGYMTAIADIQTLSAGGAPEDASNTEDDAEAGGGVLEHLNP